MRHLTDRVLVKLHDRKLQQDLHRDEEGLTMLAYAMGAAVIVVPLAIAVFALGDGAVEEASDRIDGALKATA
jgi:Flp pilus assembly pilin Flp